MTHSDTYLAFMMDHAAGNHAEPFALAGDVHVLLSATGAETADLWSIIGGVLLEDGPPEVAKESSAPRSLHKTRGTATRAEDLIRERIQGARWRKGLFGIQYAPAGPRGAKLMKLNAGQSVPAHGHKHLEATVVLSGQFSDGHGTYGPGDLVLGEPGKRHKPRAVGDDPCICLVAQKPNPLWGWLI